MVLDKTLSGERQKIFRVVYNKVMNGHIPTYEASLKY